VERAKCEAPVAIGNLLDKLLSQQLAFRGIVLDGKCFLSRLFTQFHPLVESYIMGCILAIIT
jgi:hypothetical protein